MNFDWRAPIQSPKHSATRRRKQVRSDEDSCLSDDEPHEKHVKAETALFAVDVENAGPSEYETLAAADACFGDLQLRSFSNAASSCSEPTGIFGASLGILARNMGFPHCGHEDFLLLLFGGSATEELGTIVGLVDLKHPLGITVDSVRRLFFRTRQLSLAAALSAIRAELNDSFSDPSQSQHSLFHQYSLLALHCAVMLRCNFVGVPSVTRAVEVCSAIPILMITLGNRSQFAAPFCAFLQERRVNFVSKDTWSMLCLFCRQLQSASLESYSHLDSWPTVIDEFVTWLREQQ
jgi:hypothetical protein